MHTRRMRGLLSDAISWPAAPPIRKPTDSGWRAPERGRAKRQPCARGARCAIRRRGARGEAAARGGMAGGAWILRTGAGGVARAAKPRTLFHYCVNECIRIASAEAGLGKQGAWRCIQSQPQVLARSVAQILLHTPR